MVPQYNLIEVEELVLVWSEERGITTNGKVTTQALKLVSEVGELCDNVGKGRDIKDDIGDCLVVLINIAKLSNLTLAECGSHAYNDIKDRKGYLNEHGNFIKEGDVDKSAKIEDLHFASVPTLFGTEEKFEVLLDNRDSKVIHCKNLDLGKDSIHKIRNVFKGKTIDQFIAFLKTAGEVL
jgi:hypothetical protein